MQIAEITLLNNQPPVYAKCANNINDKVVVTVDGNLELGVVKKFVNFKPEEYADIIRIANKHDAEKNCENCKFCKSITPEIKQEVLNQNLDMKICSVQTSLDRSKILISYTADERIDFRELVKILGSKFKARIEMRQVGNRDETKIVGCLGVCGREVCCKSYLSDFDKVSIKMAKTQGLSLNPTRINGMCGRLLCCLKYEDEFYEEISKLMPKMNSVVITPDGKGVVSNLDYLKEQVSVTFTKDETTEIKVYNLTDIKKDIKDKN